MHRLLLIILLVSPAPLLGCGDGDTTAQTDLWDDAVSDGGATHTDAGAEDGDGEPVDDATDAHVAQDGSPDAVGDAEPEAIDSSDTSDVSLDDSEGDAAPEIVEPFVCEDDASCEGRVEFAICRRVACVAGHCVSLPDDAVAASPCEDGDPCTVNTTCLDGACTGGLPADCSAFSEPPCTVGVCDTGSGGCIAVNTDEGEICDDGELCTLDDVCIDGACVGVSACDDGDACSGVEGCDAEGECIPGVPLVCESADLCLGLPACDAVFGCVLGPPADCGPYQCAAGGCPTACEDHEQCAAGNYCSAGECVPALDNGQLCTANAMCVSDHCAGSYCCDAGQCCTSDAECPLMAVDVVTSQEIYDEQSGFARVVITPDTHGLQTFVPDVSGVLERIDLMLQAPAGEGYLLDIAIWEPPPISPGESQIVAASTLLIVAPTSLPTVWTATFAVPTPLTAGKTYGVSASWINGDANCQEPCAVIWMGAEGNPYPQGEIYRTYDGGSVWASSDWNDDLWFRIWAGQHSCVDFSCVDPEP